MELSSKEVYRNQKVSLAVTIFSFVMTLLFLFYVKISATSSSTQTNVPNLNLTLDQNNNPPSNTQQVLPAASEEKQELDQENSRQGVEFVPIKDLTRQIADKYSTHLSTKTKQGFAEVPALSDFTSDKAVSRSSNFESSTELGFSLTNRDLIVAPHFSKTTSEIGTVVVNITVDKNGRVTDAIPNGRGTTTSNSQLKKEATEMAFNTRFSENQKLEEQRGTITIIFSYH